MSIENFPTLTPEEPEKDENEVVRVTGKELRLSEDSKNKDLLQAPKRQGLTKVSNEDLLEAVKRQEETPEAELEVENEEKGEKNESQDGNKDKKKKSWISRNVDKLVYGATVAGVLTSAVEGKELKNTADEEFSKKDKNKKELFIDAVEKNKLDFPTWKGAKIGDYGEGKNSDLLKNLVESNIKLELDLAALRAFDLSDKQEYIEFVRVTGKQLGLTKGSKYKDLLQAAKRNGLVLVPAEGTLQLLIQNDISDTTKSEIIKVAMKSIEYDLENYRVITKTRDWGDGTWRKGVTDKVGEGKIIFEIKPGNNQDGSQTTLSGGEPSLSNDLVNLDQGWMFMVQKESK